MKKRINTYLIISLSISIISCQPENSEELGNINKSEFSEENFKLNGKRLEFRSNHELKSTINEFQEEETQIVHSKFEKFYKSGFRSLTPMVNPKNHDLIKKLSEEINKKNLIKGNNSNNENFIIHDPYLAALVNDEYEIIVSDSIYKFTKTAGLFSAHIKDSTHLFNYLNSLEDITKNMELEPCYTRLESGGYTQIDDQIVRYISPIDDCGGSGGGGGYIPPVPQISDEERLQNIINNLPVCDGNAGGNWVQNLFGDSYVCRSYFDDRRRIKTEFWNQSFGGFYESLGVQVKTQTQTLGVWWASESDEIHLGINRVYLKYNFPQPQINAYSPAGIPNINAFRAPIYMYGGKFLTRSGMVNGYENVYIDVALSVTKNGLPFFRLDDEPILNIYIPNLPIIDEYEFNFSSGDITSQSNIRAAYKMGIDFIRDHLNGGPKVFAVTYQKSYDEIETMYIGERFFNTNDNKISKKFYEDVGFLIEASWGDSGGGWGYSVKPVTDYYRNYTHYEVDFYGVARRGSVWKGNRMITRN